MPRHWFAIVALSLAVGGCASPPPPEQKPAPAPAAPAAAEAKPMEMPPAKTGPVAPPTTEADMLASAMSAAPDAVAKDATIIAFDDKGTMRTLREGTNGFTCMPDGPSPGVDPMCLDKNGAGWAMAWMGHKAPPAGKIGFGYMLMGGSDASNTDPFATTPASGQSWVDTGPHVMVLNAKKAMEGYPTSAANPKVPYVMFPGTPYEHLMIPVK